MNIELQKAVKNAAIEISNHMLIKSSADEAIKSITEVLKDKYKYPPAKLRKLGKLYFDQSRNKVERELVELLEDYDNAIGIDEE